ncbi:MAG: DUF1643 domain-containing protein [Almyronema sp.]|uniref:DUF1643 domain-containing protein n=2 Tax=Almyronema TaxID=3114804 RepID=A0ABW6IJ79_9CYAN
MHQEAVIDQSGLYRYSLGRIWLPEQPRLAFIMLNPSRADHQCNDPTIRRCLSLAQGWGYGALEVVNLFAFRTAQPRLLKQAIAPIGSENDDYIRAAVARAEKTVLAWGNWGSWQGRDRAVLDLLATAEKKLYCLGLNQTGQPRHPLYVASQVELKKW